MDTVIAYLIAGGVLFLKQRAVFDKMRTGGSYIVVGICPLFNYFKGGIF